MLDYSKTHFNITYHPIMDNYKEFENMKTKSDNERHNSLQSWRNNLMHMVGEGDHRGYPEQIIGV